jgi:iron(III) transport system substrate-binding protein
LLAAFVGFGSQTLRAESARVVHVYCAQDQVYAAETRSLRRFIGSTASGVLPVFDSEAVKTVGLANRLIAERRRHPVADVYWGNEELRARQLAAMGISSRDQRLDRIWSTLPPDRLQPATSRVGPRARRPVSERHPISAWNGRLSLAFPGFGQHRRRTSSRCVRPGARRDGRPGVTRLAGNKPYLEEGNSQVVRRVARGEAWIGLTDPDSASPPASARD